MRPPLSLDEAEQQRFAMALNMMETMNELRHVWVLMRPLPPLTRSDFMLLSCVQALEEDESGPVTVSRLAARMRQSVPGISQKVSMLEREGYIQRTASKEDRRTQFLALTKTGHGLVDRCTREFLGRLQQALDMMGERDAETLSALLDKLWAAVKTIQEENKPEC